MIEEGVAHAASALAVTISVLLLGAASTSHASSTSCKVAVVFTNMPPSSPFILGGNLVGVAAASASNAWAVGYVLNGPKQQLETWHWNGRNWGPVASKAVTGNLTPLFAVAATAGDAWTVGGRSGDRTIVLHWRRGAWAVVPVPPALRKAGLSSVAVVSPRDVWAVGSNSLQHWNGKGWSGHSGPNFHDGSYAAVARIPGTAQVWVTGFDGNGGMTSARWSGSDWELAPLPPRLGGSGAIGAVSASNAWLATVTSTGAQRQRSGFLRWDGSAWTAVAVPNPAPFDEIRSVSVRSATDAWAVGELSPRAGSPLRDVRSWVLHWDGTAWSRLQAPAGSGLNAVAVMPGTRDAWAVGGSMAVRYHC